MKSIEKFMILLWRLVISFIVIIMATSFIPTLEKSSNWFIIGIFGICIIFIGACIAYFGLLFQKQGIEKLKQSREKK